MKKILYIVLAAVILAGLAVGGFFFYKTTTPEYALAKTIIDVKESGIDGLKAHLTEDAAEKIEAVEDWTDNPGVAGLMSIVAQDSAVSFIKTKMSEVNWSVEDILKGKKQSDVVIGFDYNDSIVGTISITMIKEDHKWKIDGFAFPEFEKLSLW